MTRTATWLTMYAQSLVDCLTIVIIIIIDIDLDVMYEILNYSRTDTATRRYDQYGNLIDDVRSLWQSICSAHCSLLENDQNVPWTKTALTKTALTKTALTKTAHEPTRPWPKRPWPSKVAHSYIQNGPWTKTALTYTAHKYSVRPKWPTATSKMAHGQNGSQIKSKL